MSAHPLSPVPVNPASLPTPSGYSHGTLAGNALYLGGQTALDADMKIVPGRDRRAVPPGVLQRPDDPAPRPAGSPRTS